MEVLENLHGNASQNSNHKVVQLYHPKLQGIKQNFAQPSPDQLIHINRND